MKRLLASFNQSEPAKALKERLERAGIQVAVHDETFLQRFGFMTKPAAAEKVEVDERDYDTAFRLMKEWDVHIDMDLKYLFYHPKNLLK